MEEQVKSLIKPALYIAAAVIFVACMIKPPQVLDDYFSYVGYAISVVTIIFTLYAKWLWRFNPLVKIPKLNSKYKGIIKYNFNNKDGQKNIKLEIKQTLFSIKVKAITDINRSRTITGSIALEGDEYYLYYVYITDPSSVELKGNSIQYGTCRLLLEDVNNLNGKYWTTSRTIGDIELTKL